MERESSNVYGYCFGNDLKTYKQLLENNAYKLKIKCIYEDENASDPEERSKLEELFDVVRCKDVVIIPSFIHLSNSVRDFLNTIKRFKDKDVTVLTLFPETNQNTPMGELLATVCLAYFKLGRNKRESSEELSGSDD